MLFCVIAFTELYLYIITRRLKQAWQQSREAKYKEKITNMLAHIVLYDDQDDVADAVSHFLPRFKKLPLRNRAIRELLVKELLDYHANFTGKTAEILKGLYLGLRLDAAARKKIKSRYWETQIEGIREVTQMWIREEAELILKLTDDENSQLRMEAQTAFVKLSSDDPFRFLDRARERILEWHQLVLFEVITKTRNVQIPSFSKWLSSRNDSVVMLCLKLVKHYQQFDAIPDLIRLLGHPNLKIRIKTINILGILEAEMAEEDLFQMYFEQPVEIKAEIIKAMGRISSGNFLEFLKSRTQTDDFKIRMDAFRSIKLHGAEGRQLLDNIYQSTTTQNKAIIKHVLDERIKG